MDRVDVAIVGAGHAGLATSHELTVRGIEHVVLERGRVGQTWRDRWDSFCLVTPNWTVQLPGGVYDGDDPDGYLPRDGIVAHLERYASGFKAPVREGSEVLAIDRSDGGAFILQTPGGDLLADRVVLATGAYQRSYRPAAAADLPADLPRVDVNDYRNPSGLPPGDILIIGSGQSGCQIAEELHNTGRRVVLSCGRAPWAPRRIGGHDIVWWLAESGFLDAPLSSLPDLGARLWANILATGRDGGHDLHLRTLQAMGVTLAGRIQGVEGEAALFADDLEPTIAWGDARYRQLMELFQKLASERGLAPLDLPEPAQFDVHGPDRVSLRGFGAVVFAGGFRPGYREWLPWQDAFDEYGFPIQREGASTIVPGLYFVGVHFLRKRKSALFYGVGEDAGIVAAALADDLRATAPGRRHSARAAAPR
jgi:putative flavoprotein involved in K+ transport